MTIVWFLVWLIADHVGGRAALSFDPPTVWSVTLVLAIALDLNRPQQLRRGR